MALRRRTLASVRNYATRRPERPPARFPDPLTSAPPHLSTTKSLADGVTFFHRPPPSAPTPLSTTLAPSSPLLRPSSSSSTLANEGTNDAKSSSAQHLSASVDVPESSSNLPPRVSTPRVFSSNEVLSEETLLRMRELRNSDPAYYTRGRLAKMFNCPPFLVGQKAPLEAPAHRDALAKREKLHEELRSNWGERKALVKAIQKKRREFW